MKRPRKGTSPGEDKRSDLNSPESGISRKPPDFQSWLASYRRHLDRVCETHSEAQEVESARGASKG